MARPTLDSSVKFKLLVSDLGLPRPYVRGLLESMWDVCHATGDPILGTEKAIEAAAEWPGDRGVFFEAMREGVWIEQAEDGRWMVHDYWQHCPDYVLDRLRKELERRGVKIGREEIRSEARNHPHRLRERLIESRLHPRQSEKVRENPGKSPAPAPAPARNDQCSLDSGVASRIVCKPKSRTDKAAIRRFATESGFEDWWQIYPKKQNKADAEKAWTFNLVEKARFEMIRLTSDYLSRRSASKASGEWVPDLPLGGTFLRNERWTDVFELRDPEEDSQGVNLADRWKREDEVRVTDGELQ